MEPIADIEQAIDFVEFERNQNQRIASLHSHPGWQLLRQHFVVTMSVIKNQLVVEQDPKEIVRLQERYRAFEQILDATLDFKSLVAFQTEQLQELREQAEVINL